jgi:hypothetical protein
MASSYIKVKNFEQFQHYRERNPIWIKLYYSTLDDYENRIPYDLAWIAKKLALTDRVKLEPLINAGFITICDASNGLASCQQNDTPEKETEKETDRVRESDLLFELAWQAYPKRSNNPRKAAKAGWDARIKDGVEARDLLSAVDRYAAYCKASKTAPRFVMMAATFFGPNERWKDDYSVEDENGRGRNAVGGADQGAGEPRRSKYEHLTIVSGAEPAA